MDARMLQPFEIAVSHQVLDDLSSRLRSARLPSDVAADWNAGMSPAYLRELVTDRRDRFDWAAQEALLNRFHHYLGEVDGTRLISSTRRAMDPRRCPSS